MIHAILACWLSAAAPQAVSPAPTHSGRLICISSGLEGATANGLSCAPRVSNDGSAVCFRSSASNLVAQDRNAADDVFVFQRASQQLQIVSLDEQGRQFEMPCAAVGLSRRGDCVWFLTNRQWGDGLSKSAPQRLYRRELAKHTSRQVPVPAVFGDAFDVEVVELPSGVTFFAFTVGRSPANRHPQIYCLTDDDREPILVSRDKSGLPADGHSQSPAISADGKFIAFWSLASNLCAGDRNEYGDVFLFETKTRSVSRMAEDVTEHPLYQGSSHACLSGDGAWIGFSCWAPLPPRTQPAVPWPVPKGAGSGEQIFLQRTGEPTASRMSFTGEFPVLSADGKRVGYYSATVGGLPGREPMDAYFVIAPTSSTEPLVALPAIRDLEPLNFLPVTSSLSADGKVAAFLSDERRTTAYRMIDVMLWSED
jgi:hypothetical protein